MTKIEEFVLLVQKSICKVKRNAENEHHKSKYADLEGVLDILNPYFSEHNVLVDQQTVNVGGAWCLRTTFTLGEDVKNWDIPLLGYDSKTPMQSLGSAITFARRYSLKNIFKLVDSDDDGNAVTPSGAPSKAARKSEVDKMLRAFAGLHITKSEVETIVQADVENFTLEEMESLKTVFKAIKSGEKTKEDYLKQAGPEWQE